jgi:hypothetical protein
MPLSWYFALVLNNYTRAATLAFCATTLFCACSSLSKPTELAIQLEKDAKGKQRQCVRVRDMTVMTWEEMQEVPESGGHSYAGADGRFDFRLDRGKRTVLMSNGSRNLSPIGFADEAKFRELIENIKIWDLQHIDAIAKRRGVKPEGRGGRWSPADLTCTPGLILATRMLDGGETNDVGALVYVKSLSMDGELVLSVSRRPE